MEPNGSLVQGVKENGADGNVSLEPKEHSPSAVGVKSLPDPVSSSVAECHPCALCIWNHPKGDAPTNRPATDAKLRPSLSPSMQAINDILVTKIRKNENPKEIVLLYQKDAEWSFYPRHGHLHTYHKGKKCHFNGVFRAYQRCSTEISLDKCFGRKKYDIDPRNGLPELNPGDKPYLRPEECPDFFQHGAAVTPVNFSRVPYVKKVDTFIPLEPLPKEYQLRCHMTPKWKDWLAVWKYGGVGAYRFESSIQDSLSKHACLFLQRRSKSKK
ncbi:spermatogenesis-associated serine-rich protein 1 [Dromiciops gliroides]|uniref:spermatogenesis-associated serine-rich protein 1 n=1 Tax=Dromiciops gliroides TaxID=33562 RepID=UPI001CC5DCD5|nr:spermatogenesis-associated serine-rich protein 1 [Dromiciops gliroides]